jgi:hypothetical protein
VASCASAGSRKIGLTRRRRGLLRTSMFAAFGATAAALAAAGPAAAAAPLEPSAGTPPTRLAVPSFRAPHRVNARRAPKPAASAKAGPGSPVRSPASVLLRPTPPPAAASPGDRAAYWDGRQYRLNPALRAPSRPNDPLGIPTRQSVAGGVRPFAPVAPSSVQVDASDNRCATIGSNEEQVAQSSVNPDLVVVAAQAFSDGTDCSTSHPFVFYSHDGGQHFQQQVIPGLDRTSGGDPSVVFDPVRQVFVYSFIAFDRDANNDPINSRVEAESSTDGAVWGNHVVLDTDRGNVTVDKPLSTVDSNPGSPHYGRVEVTLTEFTQITSTSRSSAFIGDYTDSGGFSWQGASRSINTTASNCGNGTSPAFDANGELMTAYYSCNGGDSLREDLSTDGGASWTGADVTISTIGNLSGDPEDPAACTLNTPATGSHFRCNSFPSLAGDPNPSDAGGRAFAVVWANAESGIAQIRGISTANAGASWTNPFYGAFNNNGDKFFPWLSIAGNGRVDIGYSSREDSATAANTKGTTFDEHHTDAASLARLRGGSSGEFVTYTIDGTPSDPGSLDFIGDYSGQASQDNSLDTYPVWTDLRDGSNHTRTSQLCYALCYTGLTLDNTLTFGHPIGSSFTDRLRFNTDTGFGGQGSVSWNVVAIRNGSDGTVIDNDMTLFNDRYFTSPLAGSNFSPPNADYVLENDNRGHAPSKPYYVDVHSFATLGGTYSAQWDTGNILAPAQTVSMSFSDIVRVFDSFDRPGSTVLIGLRPDPGNTSDYSLAIHAAAGPNTQGAPQAAASSGRVGFGNPAFVQYTTGTNPTDTDAVVVVNNNGGTGAYTLYRDTAAPTGAVQINGGATSTNSTAATLTLTATNPTSSDPVLDMRFSTDGGSTWSDPAPLATTANITLPAGDGAKTVLAQFRNGAGAWSDPASDTITLDTTPPTVTGAPAPALIANTTIAGGLVPVKISWAATDAGSGGVCSYQLQESVGGGALTNVALPTATTTQTTRQETPGTTYRYQVQATDCAGNPSAFAPGRQFTVRAIQETDPAIAYSNGWKTTTQAGAFGGSVKTASVAGRTATFSFTGALSVAWVSTNDTSSGGAHVLLDNATPSAINLNNASSLPGRLVYVSDVNPSSPHILRITVDGTARNPKVTVDAFVVIQ